MLRNVSSPLPSANGHAKYLLYQRPHCLISARQYRARIHCLPGKETILIFLLVFSSKFPIPYQPFSLSSFWVRVIETASISYNCNCTDHLKEYCTVFKHMVSNARQPRIKFLLYLPSSWTLGKLLYLSVLLFSNI